MKDIIVLHKEDFERWIEGDGDHCWQSLCEEAEKPERLEAWAVVRTNADTILCYSKAEAEQYNGRIIKLVEEADLSSEET